MAPAGEAPGADLTGRPGGDRIRSRPPAL